VLKGEWVGARLGWREGRMLEFVGGDGWLGCINTKIKISLKQNLNFLVYRVLRVGVYVSKARRKLARNLMRVLGYVCDANCSNVRDSAVTVEYGKPYLKYSSLSPMSLYHFF
jgi:hypothetical protein